MNRTLTLRDANQNFCRCVRAVATAAEAGCSAILTEDLAEGTMLSGMQAINPFIGSGLSENADRVLRVSA